MRYSQQLLAHVVKARLELVQQRVDLPDQLRVTDPTPYLTRRARPTHEAAQFARAYHILSRTGARPRQTRRPSFAG